MTKSISDCLKINSPIFLYIPSGRWHVNNRRFAFSLSASFLLWIGDDKNHKRSGGRLKIKSCIKIEFNFSGKKNVSTAISFIVQIY